MWIEPEQARIRSWERKREKEGDRKKKRWTTQILSTWPKSDIFLSTYMQTSWICFKKKKNDHVGSFHAYDECVCLLGPIISRFLCWQFPSFFYIGVIVRSQERKIKKERNKAVLSHSSIWQTRWRKKKSFYWKWS